MLKKVATLGICSLVLLSMMSLSTCEKQVAGPAEDVLQLTGVSKSEVNWVMLSAEYAGKIDELAKSGYAGGWVSPEYGGFVGGMQTFGNSVYFPAGAVQSRTYVTVDAVIEEVNGVRTISYEFLPSMTFSTPVTINLSWAFLDISYDDIVNGNYQIYYSQDDETWYPIDKSTVTVNYYWRTISFPTDHFTRYGWGF